MSAVMPALSPMEAQRLTQRIKLVASTVRDSLVKLRGLVEEARVSQVWQVLGYPSWTAYLADTLADEPMRLGREERQELVGYLAGEGLSTRAIAPIVGASVGTVHADREVFRTEHLPQEAHPVSDTRHEFPTADTWTPDGGFVNEATGEVTEDVVTAAIPAPQPVPAPEPRAVTGLDGKTYTAPATKETRRRSLVDDAYTASRDLIKALERVRTIRADDRFTQNKAGITTALQSSADLAAEVLADFRTNTIEEN